MHLPLSAAKPRGQAVQHAPRARLRTAARGGDARPLSVRYNTHTTRTARRAHGRAALTAAEALLHAAQSGLGGSLQHSGGALHGRPSASTAARPGGAEETGLQLSTAARRSGAVLCCANQRWYGTARHGTARDGTADLEQGDEPFELVVHRSEHVHRLQPMHRLQPHAYMHTHTHKYTDVHLYIDV